MGDKSEPRPGYRIGDGATVGSGVFVGLGVRADNGQYPSRSHVQPSQTDTCEGALMGAGAMSLPFRIRASGSELPDQSFRIRAH